MEREGRITHFVEAFNKARESLYQDSIECHLHGIQREMRRLEAEKTVLLKQGLPLPITLIDTLEEYEYKFHAKKDTLVILRKQVVSDLFHLFGVYRCMRCLFLDSDEKARIMIPVFARYIEHIVGTTLVYLNRFMIVCVFNTLKKRTSRLLELETRKDGQHKDNHGGENIDVVLPVHHRDGHQKVGNVHDNLDNHKTHGELQNHRGTIQSHLVHVVLLGPTITTLGNEPL